MRGKSFSGSFGESRRIMFSLCITTLLSIVLYTEVVEGKVRCYVCSWQSPVTYGSQNMTDTCSHYNFDPAYAVTIECELGCEAVSIRKSKNENIVNFYKNCIPESKIASQLEDKCMETEEKMQYITTCECSSNLCNAAGRLDGLYFATTLSAFVSIVKSHFNYFF